MSLDLQIEKSPVTTESIYIVSPEMRFTEAQKNNDEKKYSTKDIFEACEKVATVATANTEAAPVLGRG